jgi:predicted acylesterase/phospholipase RssA
VAASSSVPGLFEPLVLPDLYDGKTVRLVDGGVYDNQGVASLLEQDCTMMLVSDASGQMEALDHPSGARLGVPLRSFSVSMARVRQAQYQELAARLRSGLLKGLAFLHLNKDLDADPVDWRERQDPHEASDEARPADRRGVETRYLASRRQCSGCWPGFAPTSTHSRRSRPSPS